LSVKGYSQSTIANVLNVSQGLISSDIAYLRQKAKEALADYLENKLPLIFQESMADMSDAISQTWEIINNPMYRTTIDFTLYL
jgi:predicted transcriptional regulator